MLTILVTPGVGLLQAGGVDDKHRSSHRIRVTLVSCRFSNFCRNPNTGAPEGEDEEFCLAHQTAYYNETYPFHVLLPVIPPRPEGKEG